MIVHKLIDYHHFLGAHHLVTLDSGWLASFGTNGDNFTYYIDAKECRRVFRGFILVEGDNAVQMKLSPAIPAKNVTRNFKHTTNRENLLFPNQPNEGTIVVYLPGRDAFLSSKIIKEYFDISPPSLFFMNRQNKKTYALGFDVEKSISILGFSPDGNTVLIFANNSLYIIDNPVA